MKKNSLFIIYASGLFIDMFSTFIGLGYGYFELNKIVWLLWGWYPLSIILYFVILWGIMYKLYNFAVMGRIQNAFIGFIIFLSLNHFMAGIQNLILVYL